MFRRFRGPSHFFIAFQSYVTEPVCQEYCVWYCGTIWALSLNYMVKDGRQRMIILSVRHCTVPTLIAGNISLRRCSKFLIIRSKLMIWFCWLYAELDFIYISKTWDVLSFHIRYFFEQFDRKLLS